MEPTEYVLSHRLHTSTPRQERLDALESHLKELTKHADLTEDTFDEASYSAKSANLGKPIRRTLHLKGEKDLLKVKAAHKDVLLERKIEFRSHQHELCMIAGGRNSAVWESAEEDLCVEVKVVAEDSPVADASVTMMLSDESGQTRLLPQKLTDADGRCKLSYPRTATPQVVAAYPEQTYWSAFKRNPSSFEELTCERLPDDGPLGWWHKYMGVHDFNIHAGRDVRVGIIGMGVAEHPCLSHVERVDHADDLSSHGTHVCGLIAARPCSDGQYGGMAPGADVFTQRVFEKRANGTVFLPNQTVLADAIDLFADPSSPYQADLINLSLGSDEASEIVADAIQQAYASGTVCICSAGNKSTDVEFPAEMQETLAVSALGLEDWGVENSVTVFMMPPAGSATRYGEEGLYIANFSNFGSSVSCGAPGNGILSTVHPRADGTAPYGVMDGTSLSSPLVCGLLARLLADREDIRDMSGTDRSRGILNLLPQVCRDIGLHPQFGGKGMPDESLPSPIRSRND